MDITRRNMVPKLLWHPCSRDYQGGLWGSVGDRMAHLKAREEMT